MKCTHYIFNVSIKLRISARNVLPHLSVLLPASSTAIFLIPHLFSHFRIPDFCAAFYVQNALSMPVKTKPSPSPHPSSSCLFSFKMQININLG